MVSIFIALYLALYLAQCAIDSPGRLGNFIQCLVLHSILLFINRGQLDSKHRLPFIHHICSSLTSVKDASESLVLPGFTSSTGQKSEKNASLGEAVDMELCTLWFIKSRNFFFIARIVYLCFKSRYARFFDMSASHFTFTFYKFAI